MNIPWHELEACGGFTDPGGIPEAVDLLFSADPEQRKAAYWKIYNHAVVQSDLFSSAPYAARLVVDRLLVADVLSTEIADILYELHSGSGQAVLNVGPLAGESIEVLCRRIVREAEPAITRLAAAADARTRQTVMDLLQSFEAIPDP
jgi:hypothetical protein